MAKDMVVIGCRLPHGLILEDPADVTKTVTLKGSNASVIIGSTCGMTDIDAEFWGRWKAHHKDFPALKNGAIFEAKTHGEAKTVAKEVEKEKTGFEPMPQEAEGVKPAKEE